MLSSKTGVIKYILLGLIMAVCLSGCGSTPDGEYAASVSLTGGSGKAYIESPCVINIKNGRALADIIWSSPNYDYMLVDNERYEPVNKDGNSEFIIPVELDKEMTVQADTIAMSTPHLIEYKLTFSIENDSKSFDNKNESLAGESNPVMDDDMSPVEIPGIEYMSTDENFFASGFKIHRYKDGYILIAVRDGRKYLIVPEKSDYKGDARGITVLNLPVTDIYLAASAAASQFDELGALDRVRFVATDRDGWYVDAVIDAMDRGEILYGGKYSAPDYEALVAEDVDLAIENTMILHSPKVIEKLEQLGIPVIVDWSSYEEGVFGRLEWILVYGILTGREDKAREIFSEQMKMAEGVDKEKYSQKKVAVFSINSTHQVVVKKKNDYFVQMIEAAGGEYLCPVEDDDESRSHMTISVEAFYEYASEADVLIYNGIIEETPKSLADLKAMDSVLEKFKAVREGKVWCIDKSLYQFTNKSGTIIKNLYEVLSEEKEKTEFIYRLK